MQDVPDLSAVLGDIPWVLVGGLAIRAYAPERTTIDVDIMIQAEDETAARAAFVQSGYTITGTLSIGGFTAERAGEPPIDVLAGREPWIDQALRQPGRDAAGYPVMPRQYLTLLKLQSGRQLDFVDVQRMIRGMSQEERAATRALVARYGQDLVEDFDGLVTLANLEFGPPQS